MSFSSILRVFHERPSTFILISLFGLLSIGSIMIYSSSAIYAEKLWGDPYLFIKKHIFHLLIGLVFLRIGIRVPYERYKGLTPFLMAFTFVLMLLVLIPALGKQVGHARRWLSLFGFSFQPSELLKLTLLIWFAGFLTRRKTVLSYFSRGILPSLIVMGVFLFLLLLQPDFGTAVLIALSLLLMMFVAGVKPSHTIASLVGLGIIGFFLIISKTYRLRRITGFLDPWADPYDTGFQLIQSFIAFGTGGIFGRNLGNSRQKMFFLPEGHTDFIFSILAEEVGFIGVFFVIVLITVLLIKGLQVAFETKDDFGRNLAFGISVLIVLQCILNIGVVTGLLPTKGIPLPFISYGGSSLILSMFMIGILLNISNRNTRNNRS